jgi:integration host factor subunit beta
MYNPIPMNRSDLIQTLSIKFPELSSKDAEQAVRIILDGISFTLEKRGRVEIRGFGSFVINHRPPRTGRNPKTGVTVKVPAKVVPHFKAGKELRERANERFTNSKK